MNKTDEKQSYHEYEGGVICRVAVQARNAPVHTLPVDDVPAGERLENAPARNSQSSQIEANADVDDDRKGERRRSGNWTVMANACKRDGRDIDGTRVGIERRSSVRIGTTADRTSTNERIFAPRVALGFTVISAEEHDDSCDFLAVQNEGRNEFCIYLMDYETGCLDYAGTSDDQSGVVDAAIKYMVEQFEYDAETLSTKEQS